MLKVSHVINVGWTDFLNCVMLGNVLEHLQTTGHGSQFSWLNRNKMWQKVLKERRQSTERNSVRTERRYINLAKRTTNVTVPRRFSLWSLKLLIECHFGSFFFLKSIACKCFKITLHYRHTNRCGIASSVSISEPCVTKLVPHTGWPKKVSYYH